MAIFIPPRGSDETLSSIQLLDGELVYNTTKKKFYTGDGVTSGGIPVFEDNQTDMSIYATKADIAGLLSGELDPLFGSISGSLATKDYVDAHAREIVNTNDNDFATKEEAQSYVAGASAVFALKEEIPEVDGFISEVDADIKYATNSKVDTVSSYIVENFVKTDTDSFTVSGEIIDSGNVVHQLYTKVTNTSFALTTDADLGSTELKDTEYQDKIFTFNIGVNNVVSGFCASAFGKGNKAIGAYSFAHGYKTTANSSAAHAEGHSNKANAGYSHVEGQLSETNESYSHAEGYGAKTYGKHSHAEGGMYNLDSVEYYAETHAKQSHAEGVAKTYGDWSHAEGLLTSTSGIFAHSEGYFAEANAQYSHAEGGHTKTNGSWSHAEGNSTVAYNNYSHTEGENTKTKGDISHAEGYGSTTYARGAHAEGDSTQVSGSFAHAEGLGTIAVENYQHVEGKLNIPLTGYQHIVGNGIVGGARKNIQTLDWEGNQVNAGTMTAEDFIIKNENETVGEKLNGAMNLSQSNYEILMNIISQLQDQIIALKQTNVETYAAVDAISDPSKDAIIAASSMITTAEIPTSVANIIAKSIQVKDLDVDSIRLNFTAEDDVKIVNFESSGTLSKSISNASNSINTNGYITIKDCTIAQNGYNAVEIGLNNEVRSAGVTIDNVHFAGTFSNNVVLIFDTADDAIINISNCTFDNCDNPLRISNRSNGKLTVNVINCEFTIWGNGGNPAYNGMIICEDYTSSSAAAELENNRFAPSKVKINIINCTHNGVKIANDNPIEVCGTKNENQLLYVYYDKTGFINYDADRYPHLVIK